MNQELISKIYAKHYQRQMNRDEYQQCLDGGIELLRDGANHVSYHTDQFKHMLLAIEYNNELLYDLLETGKLSSKKLYQN